MPDLNTKTAVVVGASRGLGKAVASALADAGANVIAVSRTATAAGESIPTASIAATSALLKRSG